MCISVIAYFREVLTILCHKLTLRETKAVALSKFIRHCGSAVTSPAFLNKVPAWSYTNNGVFLFHSGNLLTHHEQHLNCSEYF